MISIVIPVYNHPQRLERALTSVTKQTYDDYEVIVVDDGSKDLIEPTIQKFETRIPKLHHYRIPHGGANKAREYGYELASGEYLIFWDDDVVGRPVMLETMLRVLRGHPRASYVYSSYKYGLKSFKIWPFQPDRLRKMPYIHTTSLVRYKHFPGWDPTLKRLQDWDVWLCMLEKGFQGVYIPQYLFRIITGGAMSSWLPKYAYKKPFKYLLPKKIKIKVKQYEEAVMIIKKKHKI